MTQGEGRSREIASALAGPADNLLKAIGDQAEDIGGGALTLHWPTIGQAFDHGVLVVGQAVFGWMGNWKAADATDVSNRASIISDAKNPFPDFPDPMGWIDRHRVHNSPFWRVAHEVTDALAAGDAPWFSRLAWANLYPVAPNDVKANPSGLLLEAQTAAAADFLTATIAAIRPSLVLVVGGPYIWPFVEPLEIGVLKPAEKPLYLTGRRGDLPWVVGMHPGGASRRGWGPVRYAELIVAAARSIATEPNWQGFE